MKNRLAHEKSPYLLQHAENPVDWYPWGEEAFAKAAREEKPIFLSIGYSTCHWCHVMERESFQDPEVGAIMNKTFVSIKVDREERPDIDGVYMKVCQMMTGRGGWPLTILMTPDKKPFFAGTYIPKKSRYGMLGLADLTVQVGELWRKGRDRIYRSAESVYQELARRGPTPGGPALGPQVLDAGYEGLKTAFDPEHGGFNGAPKFPMPHNLLFFLRYWKRTGEQEAIQMVETTLSAMGKGGIHDHIGGGFHRYSTDREWLIPHFEKMLYDQALLAMAYTEAYAATRREEYRSTLEDVLEYVLRDMRAPESAFYTAEDADSEGEEGKFYLWTYQELEEVLTPEDFAFLKKRFDIQPQGNFTDEATGLSRPRIILRGTWQEVSPAREIQREITAENTGKGEGAEKGGETRAGERWERIKGVLFHRREQRVHPLKDTKILTDWNGLMIAALAKAAWTLENPEYLEAAERAARFILQHMVIGDGTVPDHDGSPNPLPRILHRYKDGQAEIPGFLSDYAFLAWGLVELYEASFNPLFLEKARQVLDSMIQQFWDEDGYGFFFTSSVGEQLLVREKETYDGALPSGNSVAAYVLLRLSRLTGDVRFEEYAEKTFRALSPEVSQYPAGYTLALIALSLAAGGSKELVVIGKPGTPDTTALLNIPRSGYYPDMALHFISSGEKGDPVRDLAPFTRSFTGESERAVAYACSGFRCQQPTQDPARVKEFLEAP